MKTFLKLLLPLALCLGLVAWALPGTVAAVDYGARWMKSGFFVTPTGAQVAAANQVTRMLGGSATIDFASVTITCEDSAAITVTGAAVGDPCFVGPPTTISGAGTGLHSSFTCYVSAADNVKVRHCAAGTADNPASATFYVRVISSQ